MVWLSWCGNWGYRCNSEMHSICHCKIVLILFVCMLWNSLNSKYFFRRSKNFTLYIYIYVYTSRNKHPWLVFRYYPIFLYWTNKIEMHIFPFIPRDIYIYIYILTSLDIYLSVSVYLYIFIYIYIYISIYLYIYISIYIAVYYIYIYRLFKK